MPLYKTITPQNGSKVLIWNIKESFEELKNGIKITEHCEKRLRQMKSNLHRRGYLSIRKLMAEMGFNDTDLEYGPHGKPHLKSPTHFISITHSYEFSGIIVSPHRVGIDIEKQRHKILRIAPKFTRLNEFKQVANEEALIRKLSVVWGAKESLYKLHGVPGLSFLDQIRIDEFTLSSQKLTAQVLFAGERHDHLLHFFEFEGFTGVFTVY